MHWIEKHPSQAVALISAEDRASLTFGELGERTAFASGKLREFQGCVALLECSNRPVAIIAYLACLHRRIPLIFAEAKGVADLIRGYSPELLILPSETTASSVNHAIGYREAGELATGYRLWLAKKPNEAISPHPSLALMLSTSGSTGSAKLVRLSLGNLESNAAAIAEYLHLRPDERSIQGLPLHYSYGLSLLNSHLFSGATTVLTAQSFMRPEFWGQFDEFACTSFAGVPYMYEVLHRLRIDPAKRPTLRYFTQAGGPLKPELTTFYQQSAAQHGKPFVVMYGQTEATARISYVPPRRLAEKVGSIGVAIPGGTLELEEVGGEVAGEVGVMQLRYSGPNVMLGYAESRTDLALGDELKGVLRTGDVARVDEDGFFYLQGRLQRFAKLFGKRISLVDIEHKVERDFPCRCAAIEAAGSIRVFVEGVSTGQCGDVRHMLAAFLEVPPAALKVEALAELPQTSSGKKNYKALET